MAAANGAISGSQLFYFLDELGGDAADDGPRGDILGHHGTGSHDGALADGHAWQDGDIGAEPHLVLNVDGPELHVATTIGVLSVVDGAERGVVTDQAVVADVDTALVLELAAGIDKRAVAHHRVFPEVGVERREHADALGHLKAPQLGEQMADFLRLMVLVVQSDGDLLGFAARPVHEQVSLGTGDNRLARCDVFFVFLNSHGCDLIDVLIDAAKVRRKAVSGTI